MNVLAGLLALAATAALSLTVATATARGFQPGGPAAEVDVGPLPAQPQQAEPEHETASADVTIAIDGEQRRAIVTEPVAGGGALPAVVLVHGSGPADRHALAAEAEALAARGIVVVRYDKRVSETGPFSRDYAVLADDAADVAAWAAARDGVDPRRVGVVGWSEGGWVAPLAAARDERIAFVGLVSAPVVSPLENAAFAVDHAIAGAPAPMRAIAATALAGGREVIDYGAFDVREAAGTLDVPLHAVFGADDATVPVAVAIDRLRQLSPGASVELVEGAGHGVPVATGWIDRLGAFIAGDLARAPTPGTTTGAVPTQAVGLLTLPERSWQLDPRLHLAAAAFAGIAAALLVPRGSRGARPRPRLQEATP